MSDDKDRGWHIHYVFDDGPAAGLVNAHTHGLPETYSHPDLQVVVPMPEYAVADLIWTVVEGIKAGTTYEAGKDYGGILKGGYKVRFVAAPESGRVVLRMIIPDPQGSLDGGHPWSLQYEGAIIGAIDREKP